MIPELTWLMVPVAGAGCFLWWRWGRKPQTPPQEILLARSFEKLLSGSTVDVLLELRSLYAESKQDVGVGLALGIVFRRRGETKAAIRIHRGLAKRPEIDDQMRAYLLTELCADYLVCGLLDRAKIAIDKAAEYSRNDDWFVNKASETYLKLGLYDGACQVLNRAAVGDKALRSKRVAFIRNQQGKTLMEAGEHKLALDAFKKALAVDPRCIPAYVNISTQYRMIEKPKKALNHLTKSKRFFSDYFWVYLTELSKVSTQMGDHPRFLEPASARLEASPDDWRSRWVLARFLRRMGAYRDAFQHLLICIRKAPNVLLIHQAIWELLLKNPDFTDEFTSYAVALDKSLVFSHPFECAHCRYSKNELFWTCPSCHRMQTCTERRI